MAALFSALVFPYTSLADKAWDGLTGAFDKTFILQAAGMKPSPRLESLLETGSVEAVRPGAGLFEPDEVEPILAEAVNWIANIRHVKEISHLRGILSRDMDESSPLALATAIRRHGRDREDTRFLSHLLLHLAAWHDERQREADETVAGLEARERSLKESLGGGPEDEGERELFASLDPLSATKTGPDPLLRLRLEAWAKLFSQAVAEADLWVTSTGMIRYLAEEYEERTGEKAVSLNTLDPEQVRDILAETGLGYLTDQRFGFLDLWYFDSAGRESLAGVEGAHSGTKAIIGGMRP